MGRNAERNEEARKDQRARILSGSLRLFVQRGFAATRIGDIARQAGIAQGLIYHYFQSKDEILAELLRESLAKMDQAAKDLEAMDAPASTKIRLALDALLQGIQTNDDTGRHHLLVALTSASDALPDAARELISRHARNPHAVMRRVFAAGQAEGSVRPGDPKELAMLFWSLIKGLAIHHAVHGNALGRATPSTIFPLFLLEAPCKA